MVRRCSRAFGYRGIIVTFCLALLAGCGGASVLTTATNLVATAGNATVNLSWTVVKNATSYDVQRATASGGPYSIIAQVGTPAYTDSSVTNGTTYYYVVSALDAAGTGPNSAQASATPEPPLQVPSVPQNLTATAGNAEASLNWSASSGASSYTVQRAVVSGGPYTQVAAATSPSYTDTAVTNGTTYYYVVSAANSAGDSAVSAQATATPDPAVTTPRIPLGLTATAGNGEVSLTWSPSSGATDYHVKRSTTSSGPYTQIGTPSSASYMDSSVQNATTYYYVVSAVDAAGESANSMQVSAVPAAPTTIPAQPLDLTATPGNDLVSLTWSPSSGATSYRVKRATASGGPYSQVGEPTSAAFTDTSAQNGTTYYYVVSALDSAGESADSVQVTAHPVESATIPTAPMGLTAIPGNSVVSLTWSASSGATSYHVQRATASGGPYTQVGGPTSAAYTDMAVQNGTTYYYVVSALNSAGESADSAQVSAQPVAPATTPTVPTDLTANPGDGQVSLTWSASSGATRYNVNRSTTSGGPYAQIGAPTSNGYTDTSVTAGTTYFYVVSAVDSAGSSANSNQVSAIPLAPLPPPTTFGTWINVTPAGVDLSDVLDCGNYGTETVQVDPMNPSNLYTEFNCQGIWKSTDYGLTWTGPINTGTNGATAGDCAGGITIPSSGTTSPPVIFQSCIRGNGTGFWKSLDGGVSWTNYFVAPSGTSRQDYYPPVVDPYDPTHLLMAGHEMDYLVQSVDGGQTWTNVTMASGMLENGGTGAIFFINTGNASSTRGTWLWMAQQSGGTYGTWRTTNGGANWVQVDKNEHPHGASQLYQPSNHGVVYIAGAYSALGWGVLRSADYGQTWTHVGETNNETVVFGTPDNVYSMFGYPVGIGGVNDPSFETAAQPGTGTWVAPGTPAALAQGSAQIQVVNNGSNNIFVGAMWNSGLWRYIEP